MNMLEFRRKAADTLKSTPKQSRSEKLAELQATPEYWAARVEKLLGSGQKAEFSDDRTTFHWKVKNVYHGTDVDKIDKFNYAEESTIGGSAVYFTTDPELAMGYAKLRGLRRGTNQARLYESVLSDVKMMNWAEPTTVEKLRSELAQWCRDMREQIFLDGLEKVAEKYSFWKNVDASGVHYSLKTIIERCEGGEVHRGNVKEIAQGLRGMFFERFVKERGLDGVITIEGGDDPKHTAKSGISVVIYNKDKIISHRSMNIPAAPPDRPENRA